MTRAVESMSGAAPSLRGADRISPANRVRSLLDQRRVRARSERSLIAGALAGCEADMEELFMRHWPRAYRAAYPIVHDHAGAEDIAQEAFVAAVRRLDRFDRQRPFGPWLSAIVANRAIDWARARSARRESGGEPGESTAAAEPAGGYSPQLLAALRALSPDHRAVVVLRDVLEYTPGEIAQALELPRGTVNSRLRRGLDALERQLREADR
jgi:RNA polymerase sigma-70 factor (ECF subfamily)